MLLWVLHIHLFPSLQKLPDGSGLVLPSGNNTRRFEGHPGTPPSVLMWAVCYSCFPPWNRIGLSSLVLVPPPLPVVPAPLGRAASSKLLLVWQASLVQLFHHLCNQCPGLNSSGILRTVSVSPVGFRLNEMISKKGTVMNESHTPC
jgi:hypothetical protein